MLRTFIKNWFKKNQYNTQLLHKIAKVINFILYLLLPVFIIKRLFEKRHYLFEMDTASSLIASLLDKERLYRSLTSSTQDEHGFIETDHCDALLFSGLLSATKAGKCVSIRAAQSMDGSWFRRPLNYPSCYTPGGKGSTISRDMLSGLLWHTWKHRSAYIATSLQNYGRKNNWVMGEGDISRLYFSPGLRATLAALVDDICGVGSGGLDKYLPYSWPKGLTDYEAHLAMLHIELFGQIKGYITSSMKACLKDIAERTDHNALAHVLAAKWVHGDYNRALYLLDMMWPKDRLPSTHDRREPWITQRFDTSSGWHPDLDNEVKNHSGGDFLFCIMILRG